MSYLSFKFIRVDYEGILWQWHQITEIWITTGTLISILVSLRLSNYTLNTLTIIIIIGTGQPDIRALQPNKMYRNAGDGKHWQDVTFSGNFGHLQKVF